MRVLGIETSCDETGIALYDTDAGLLGSALHSQVQMHSEYGGVVPELASRDHVNRILPLTAQVFQQARCLPESMDAIAYTRGPGLVGALMVGAAMAAGLSYAWRKPVVPVHHLEGHILSPLLSANKPDFPFVALLCSGGHTQLLAVKSFGQYELLGETLDDAAGEAFDKSAKLLGLGYPGGPALARLADDHVVDEHHQHWAIQLPRPMMHGRDAEFSFSGLKTAVAITAQRLGKQDPEGLWRSALAYEVQAAITDVLIAKSVYALKLTGLNRLVISGGVSANRKLRAGLQAQAQTRGFELFFPELSLCTDNGAMIALAGAMRLQHGAKPTTDFSVAPRWPLEDLD
jgi:N6-L-threonylcarbamoyladenine synthase